MVKKFAFLFAVYLCLVGGAAVAAGFQVKKASSVKAQEGASGIETITSGSLVPGVIGLVSSVTSLSKQQKELEAECVPTSQELDWVNKMVKEYAKSGATMSIGTLCEGDGGYAADVEASKSVGSEPSCVADSLKEDGMVWDKKYPKASTAKYCAGGGDVNDCSNSKIKTVSNVYTIFGAIGFTEEDYTVDEMNMYVKFTQKMEKCAPEKIQARKKEAYAGFIKGTISNVGQKTNTGSILDAVGGLTQGGGGLGGIQSLAPAIGTFLGQ